MSEAMSIRFGDGLAHRLRDRATDAETSVSALVQRYVDEGLRMDDHPGIVFRNGPTGRRAALVAGPDVWEVIAVARAFDGNKAESAAAQLGLSDRQVRIALGYFGEYPDEIDRRIAANERAAARAEATWRRERQLA